MRVGARALCAATVVVAAMLAVVAVDALVPHHLAAANHRLQRQLRAQQRVSSSSSSSSSKAAAAPVTPQYETFWFPQRVDHFNFANNARYGQKYLVNDTWWQRPTAQNGWNGGPIFFYTGNEAAIEDFVVNTGQVWELAPQYGALVVFAEHRYYGESMPYGSAATAFANGTTLQWLTSEQALADFATLVTALKIERNANSSAVIAFGGSYGGMLSAWFRVKYPHVVAGAWASSAPILLFQGQSDPYAFSAVVTADFAQANPTPSCSDAIRASWAILAATPLAQLNAMFQPCTPLTDASQVQAYLWPWLANAWVSMAMADYPYSTSFEGAMPPNPVNASCAFFWDGMSDDEIRRAVVQAVSVSTNYTGAATCNLVYEPPSATPLLDAGGWAYQTCTEMVMPLGQDPDGHHRDMFYPMLWDDAYVAAFTAGCQATYGVTPRPAWVPVDYGSANLLSATNIFLPNGALDPWSSGGVTTNVSDTVLANLQRGGAHHFDLRASNPADTVDAVATRQWAQQQIWQWIATPAPAIPVYTAPTDAWRTSYVVLLSLVCTLAALAVGHCAYGYFNAPHSSSSAAIDTAAAPAKSGGDHAGDYHALPHGGGDEKAADAKRDVEVPAPVSVSAVVASWPPAKDQVAGQPAAAAAAAPAASAPSADA